jgi:hypothetical protein
VGRVGRKGPRRRALGPARPRALRCRRGHERYEPAEEHGGTSSSTRQRALTNDAATRVDAIKNAGAPAAPLAPRRCRGLLDPREPTGTHGNPRRATHVDVVQKRPTAVVIGGLYRGGYGGRRQPDCSSERALRALSLGGLPRPPRLWPMTRTGALRWRTAGERSTPPPGLTARPAAGHTGYFGTPGGCPAGALAPGARAGRILLAAGALAWG